jgi:hypothetical protein
MIEKKNRILSVEDGRLSYKVDGTFSGMIIGNLGDQPQDEPCRLVLRPWETRVHWLECYRPTRGMTLC